MIPPGRTGQAPLPPSTVPWRRWAIRFAAPLSAILLAATAAGCGNDAVYTLRDSEGGSHRAHVGFDDIPMGVTTVSWLTNVCLHGGGTAGVGATITSIEVSDHNGAGGVAITGWATADTDDVSVGTASGTLQDNGFDREQRHVPATCDGDTVLYLEAERSDPDATGRIDGLRIGYSLDRGLGSGTWDLDTVLTLCHPDDDGTEANGYDRYLPSDERSEFGDDLGACGVV